MCYYATVRKLVQLALTVVALGLAFVTGAAAYKYSWPIYTMPRQLLLRALWGGAHYREAGTRWRKTDIEGSGVRTNKIGESEMESDIEARIRGLEELGYVSGSRRPATDGGVQVSNTALETGLLLVTDGHAPMAWLMDMR